jgi:hypothetical protein
VILAGEDVEAGFYDGRDAPVFQVAAATERYSGSDLKVGRCTLAV